MCKPLGLNNKNYYKQTDFLLTFLDRNAKKAL